MKKILKLIFIVFLIFSLSILSFANNKYNDQLDELQSQYEQLEQKQQSIQKEINNVKNEKSKKIAQKNQIDNQIDNVKTQINILSDKIALLEEDIATKEEELENKNEQLNQSYELLKNRMNTMYKTNNSSIIGLILGANNFFDFLSRVNVSARIAEHDKELIINFKNNINDISQIKKEIEEQKLDLENSKTEQNNKKNQLNYQLSQTKDMISDMEEMEKQYLANKAEIDKQMNEAQSEIDAIYAKIHAEENEYEGGKLGWPLPGFSYISSKYGYRFGGSDFHTGMDITGSYVYGKPIVAAASGKVIYVQTTYTQGKGYGKYIIIDHGSGISTLYGHCSSIAVKTGEIVKRGETIGYVGSTGWSTGPHLHFEVRINGAYTNPEPYIY